MIPTAKHISRPCGLVRSRPESTVVRLSPEELTITPEQVSRYAGGTRYRMDPQQEVLARDVLARARELVEPSFVHSACRVDRLLSDGSAQLDCGLTFPLPRHQEDTDVRFLTLCVCTLGGKLEESVRTIQSSGNLLHALFIDAAGTAFLEALSERACETLEEEGRKRGFHSGCRAGPGYGGLDLSWQRQLFALVDPSGIGVRINDHCVMEPAKSVSFFMPWTTLPPRRSTRDKCASCTLPHCLYRV
jgi:hypothetical protein